MPEDVNPCTVDEWTVISWPHGSADPTCSSECPVGYEDIVDDEGNWCFEPEPVPIDAQPVDPSKETPGTTPPTPTPAASSKPAAAEPVKAPVPTWIFGLAAVAGVFWLAAVLTSPKSGDES